MARLQELLTQKAAETNTPFWNIEKDYDLSYLIAGIAETPPRDELWVLKGGTALRKAYFNNYRFSEDLDYSIQSPLSEEDARRRTDEAVSVVIPSTVGTRWIVPLRRPQG